MRKTTMTVAAFLAVAASSYAAVTVGNKGYEATIAKGSKSVSIEVVLKKGSYAITATTKGTVKVTVGDKEKDPAKDFVGNGATVKIEVSLDANASEATKTTIKIEPTDANTGWVAKKQAIQNEINQLVTEASALETNIDEKENETLKAKRAALLDRASVLQETVNNMGITEYNEYIDNTDGKIPSIEDGDKGLSTLKTDVKAATANEEAYDNALAAINGLELQSDLKALKDAYEAAPAETKDAAKALYETTKANVDQFKKDADEAFVAGSAATQFSDDNIDKRIGQKDSAADKNDGSGLLGEIEDNTKAINSGSNENIAYHKVKTAVEGLTTSYNTTADKLYELLEAEGIPAGYGKEIYDDIYKDAMEDLKPSLQKILAVGEKNEADHEAGKATDTTGELAGIEYAMKGIYADVEDEVGTVKDPAAGTLRGTYKAAQATLDGYTASLDDYKKASEDTDTDKDKKVIGDYFTGKVNTLKGQIKAIQDKLDVANAAHFADKDGNFVGFDLAALADADKGYTATKAAADADLAEWKAYDESRTNINNVEKELTDPKTGANAEVAKMKSEDGKFVAADRFSTKGITDAITALRNETRANYAVTATDKKIAETFKPTVIAGTDKLKGTTAISNDINTFKTTAQTAFNHYKEITGAIADFNDEIDGKPEVDEKGNVVKKDGVIQYVIQPWAAIVTNEAVTTDGKVPTKESTFGEAKKAEQDNVAKAQDAVDKAMDAKVKEKDFSDALASAAGMKASVETSTGKIHDLKAEYQADENKVVKDWEKATAVQAKKDAIAESTARANALNDEIKKIKDYEAKDYGTKAAETLNSEKQKIYDEIGDVTTATAKADGTIAERIKAADAEPDEKAEAAIALIDKVQKDLDKIQGDKGKLATHQARATQAKADFGNFKRAYDEVYELLNGKLKKDDKGNQVYDEKTGKPVYEKKGVKQLLDPAPEDFLKTEIDEQNGLLGDPADESVEGLWKDVNNTTDVGQARKDEVKDGKVVTKGLDTRLAEVKEAVDNKKSGLESGLRQKAENESANVTAWNTWNDKLNKYETVDKKDKSVDDIINETKAAINKSQPGETGKDAKDRDLPSDGEQFFLDQLEELKDELQDLKDEAQEQYEAKLKDKDKKPTKYTDPNMNLAANGDLEDYYLDELATKVDDMKGLVALSAANETAFEAQDKAYEDAKKDYEDLLVEVNKAKDSQGEAYAATYEAAMTKLTEINSELKKYRNGYDYKDKNGKVQHENGYWETEDGKKDGQYENGASVKFDGDLKKINAIKTAIKTLSDTWNAGEDEEGSYKKAVADDNAARKTAFDNAFSKLYKTYYGEVKDAKKVEGAVDVVTKLSKLHYADQVTDAVKEIVTGTSDKCLYTYAEKITKLQNDAQKAFDAVEAPAFFDEGETWKAQAEAMATTISGLAQDYANAVNDQAWGDYTTAKNKLDNGENGGAINEAINALVQALDVTNAEALKLVNYAPEGQKGAKTILDEAMVQAGEKPNADNKLEKVIDFAYQVETNIVPNLNKALNELLPTATITAVKDNWNNTFGAIDTAEEEAAIVGFYGYGFNSEDLDAFEKGSVLSNKMEDYKQGYYSEAYNSEKNDNDQVDRLKKLENRWNNNIVAHEQRGGSLEDLVEYLSTDEVWGYQNTIKKDLAKEIATRKVGEDKDKKPIMETHTSTYWKASYEDKKYQDLKKGNEVLVAVQADLFEKLEAAVAYYEDLLVEHDEELSGEKGTFINSYKEIAKAIDKLTVVEATADKQPAVKAIEARIEGENGLIERAIVKEYEAIGVEIGEIDKAFGDQNADLRKTLNTYKKTNDGIYDDHVDGKKNEKGEYILDKDKKKIFADQAEVHERFAALEKYVGKTKGEVDETAKTAAADVAAAVEALDAKYDALKAQLAETNEYVQEAYEDEIDGLGADIDAIKAKIEKEGDAITIQKDNNLEAIEKVEADIAETSKDVEADQMLFDNQAELALTLTDKLAELTERLAAVNEAAAAYEHQIAMPEDDRWWRYDESGEKVYYTNYREFMFDNFTYDIAQAQAAVDALPAMSDLDPNFDEDTYWDEYDAVVGVTGFKDWKGEWVVGSIENRINELELALAGYDAKGYVDEVNEDLDDADEQIHEILDSMEDLNVNTDKWEALHEEIIGVYAQIDDIEEYAKNVLTTGESDVDIDGKYFDERTKEAKEIDFVTEAYPTIVAKAVELKQAVADIAAQIVTPGAITNGTTVEGGDIALISNLILGISTPEELAEEGYAVSAADVDGDGEYTVADLTLTQNMYLYGSYEGWTEEFIAKAKAREASKPVYYGVGTLGMDIATSEIAVSLEKGRSYAAIQMDVTLPAGVELADAAFAGKSDAVSVAYNKIGGNTWRVLISANDNSSVNADEALVALSIAGEGAGKVAIDNAIGATAKGKSVKLAGISGDYTIATGIAATETKVAEGEGTIFGANGAIRKQLEKGVNIIKTAGGAVKKIFVK